MVAVLLVEDDAAIRTALTRALRDHGHVVTSVGSGGQRRRGHHRHRA
jgi:CheY-like chemotaxis protein